MADKNQPLKKFGGNVRRQRDSLKLSQEQLADQTEIHRTFISGIERGVRNPGLLNVLRIAKALKTDASKLLEGISA
jgi:transcriptional regulator with XRE-family HTH domain